MFLVFEMPVGMLLQSALAVGGSRLNLFPMTGQRSCLDQKKLSIGCRSRGSWLTDGREVASCSVVLRLQTCVQTPAPKQHKEQLLLWEAW